MTVGGSAPWGQDQLVGQHGLQHRRQGVLLRPQALAGVGAGQAGDGAHRPRRGLVQGPELLPGVEPQLVRLLLPALLSPVRHRGGPWPAACRR